MENYQAIAEKLSMVRGFLIPVMSDDPIPGRRQRFGLDREGFEMVCYGVACPNCLAHYEPYVLETCPVCRHVRSPQDFIDGVAEWEAYERDRKRILEDENPVRTEIARPDQIVDAIASEHFGKWVPGQKRNL